MAKRKQKATQKKARPAWAELYNLRRRIERAAFRAYREGNEAGARALYATIAELRPTRGKKGRSASEILEKMKESGYKQPTVESITQNERRLSALFRQEIRNGNISEARARGLYAATKQIWQGRPGESRNELILDYFYGEGQEAEAFQEWAREKGYSLASRSMFVVEEYIREENSSVIQRAETEGDYPYAAFGMLVNYG